MQSLEGGFTVIGDTQPVNTENISHKLKVKHNIVMKEVLYEVGCLKSTEDMILALAGQFKQLSQLVHETVA